jgi:hypothetical protein
MQEKSTLFQEVFFVKNPGKFVWIRIINCMFDLLIKNVFKLDRLAGSNSAMASLAYSGLKATVLKAGKRIASRHR